MDSTVILTHHAPVNAPGRRPPRLLGVFAHPDDETVCAGGTFAKYASAGADVRVVSLTRGGAGQIRDASVATRSTLTAVREKELDAAGLELGLTETRCLDYPDGGLSDVDSQTLVGLAAELISEIEPDVVITFGADGFSGHPDHVAVGAAVTAACHELRPTTLPPLPLPSAAEQDAPGRSAGRVARRADDPFQGHQGLRPRAVGLLARDDDAGICGDLVDVEWYPSGTYLIEQGEAATRMYFLLSGEVEIRREGDDGLVRAVDRSGPGEFVGEVGIATGRPRNAHVVAIDDVTSLTFAATEPTPFDGRGVHPQPLRTGLLPSGDQVDPRVSTRVDVSAFVSHKIRATAAHRSQYPIDPGMFPDSILREMFGAEYFIQVLPERELDTSLLAD